jgi:hypothetical protein
MPSVTPSKVTSGWDTFEIPQQHIEPSNSIRKKGITKALHYYQFKSSNIKPQPPLEPSALANEKEYHAPPFALAIEKE